MAIVSRERPSWEESSAGFRELSSELGGKTQILGAMWNKPWKKENVVAE